VAPGIEPLSTRGARFYGVIAAATMIGIGLGFTHLDPIKALFFAAVINGVISAPIVAVMKHMSGDPKIMGQFVVTRRLKILGWSATTLMALAVVAMFVQIAH
jgi:Mn2+/Fe2+ NRAMP family transporter